jgi:enhancing lycopene biosynthesis protein 2
VLAARVLGERAGGPGVSITIGNDPQTAAAIHAMGATHVAKPVSEAHVDDRRRVITAPAYMYGEAPIHEVFEGIGDMVEQTLAHIHASQAVDRPAHAGARA